MITSNHDWKQWRTVFITENNGDYYRYKWDKNGVVLYLKWVFTDWVVIARFVISKK